MGGYITVMAIRLRKVKNKNAIGGFSYVALCAAESENHPDDVYLDDGMHSALSKKFMDDFTKTGFIR